MWIDTTNKFSEIRQFLLTVDLSGFCTVVIISFGETAHKSPWRKIYGFLHFFLRRIMKISRFFAVPLRKFPQFYSSAVFFSLNSFIFVVSHNFRPMSIRAIADINFLRFNFIPRSYTWTFLYMCGSLSFYGHFKCHPPVYCMHNSDA